MNIFSRVSHRTSVAALIAAIAPGALSAQGATKALGNRAVPAAMSAIPRGREAGTPGEMRASVWVALQPRRVGV